jgi:hypothetical protein
MALSFNYCCVVLYIVSCHFCAKHTSRNAASSTCLGASNGTQVVAPISASIITTFLLGLFLRDY